MTRSDVTVRQIKVEDLLFPASPGAYSIVSHPPKIAADGASSVVMANGPAPQDLSRYSSFFPSFMSSFNCFVR